MIHSTLAPFISYRMRTKRMTFRVPTCALTILNIAWWGQEVAAAAANQWMVARARERRMQGVAGTRRRRRLAAPRRPRRELDVFCTLRDLTAFLT